MPHSPDDFEFEEYEPDRIGHESREPRRFGSADVREPCPMCGESNSVRERECRYCGEMLSEGRSWSAGQEDSTVSPGLVKKYRCEVHGVGAVWVVITMILGVAALSIPDIPKRNANGELLDILTLAAIMGAVASFLIGFFTLIKQRWSLYVGLVFGYFGIIVTVLLLARGNVCGAIVGLLLFLAVIVQTHRAINLANLMLLHNIPLNTKPEMS